MSWEDEAPIPGVDVPYTEEQLRETYMHLKEKLLHGRISAYERETYGKWVADYERDHPDEA